MLNAFKIKKLIALTLMPMVALILFFVGGQFFGFLYGLGFAGCGILLTWGIGTILLKNPFTDMLEGKGLLTIGLDSTGILKPFIISLKSPFIHGKLEGTQINDVFDRNTIFYLQAPKKSENPAVIKDTTLNLQLTEQEYNRAKFSLYQYPVLIYNEQLHSLVTKEFLGTQESNAFAEHSILFLNRSIEELTARLREFGRYIVESLAPKEPFFKSKWFWIIIIIGGGIILALFAPQIINTFKGSAGLIKDSTQSIAKPVIPSGL